MKPDWSRSRTSEECREQRGWRHRRTFALGVVVLVLAGACGDDDGGTSAADDAADTGDDSEAETSDDSAAEAADDPAGVIEAFRIAYNAGDIDAVMELFTEDSVLTGHPLAAESSGLAAIRSVLALSLGDAADDDPLTFSNVDVADETVRWDDRSVNAYGVSLCGEGHVAIITDGMIISWTWPVATLCT